MAITFWATLLKKKFMTDLRLTVQCFVRLHFFGKVISRNFLADFRALMWVCSKNVLHYYNLISEKRIQNNKYRVDHNIFPQNFYIFHRLLCVYVCCGGSGAI